MDHFYSSKNGHGQDGGDDRGDHPPQSIDTVMNLENDSMTHTKACDQLTSSGNSPILRNQEADVGVTDRGDGGGGSAATSKKRKRAEIAASELRNLGVLPASGHGSPSQSRSGSRAGSPAIASNSTINPSASRNKTSTKKPARNIDRVFFGAYEIKTWYYSPYPFDDEDWLAFSPSNPEENRSTPNPPRKSSGKCPEGGDSKSLSKRGDSEMSFESSHRIEPSSTIASSSSGSVSTNANASTKGGALGSSSNEAPALAAENIKSSSTATETARKMWVCDGCFKYMRSYAGWNSHKKQCGFTHPPGKKVYQRGAHIIWEVDGAQAKLYAQNLSLFGKLFIDHKTIYFDVEPFTFYVLTDATTQFDHALGYFSKEKFSYDDYNLACIITFPPFQQKGFGTLMIEFSYYLSSLADSPGTPERPLSDLGLKGYLSFWSSVVLRTLVVAFNDSESPSICLPYVGNKLQSSSDPASISKLRIECIRVRRILLGLSPDRNLKAKTGSLDPNHNHQNENGIDANEASSTSGAKEKPKRNSYGWAGEIRKASSSSSTSISLDSQRPTSSSSSSSADQSNAIGRNLRARVDKGKEKADSSTPPPTETTHSSLLDLEKETPGSLELTTDLRRIAEAANLRIEDCAEALMECGLLSWKIPRDETGDHRNGDGNEIGAANGNGEGLTDGNLTLMISLDEVRKEIKKRGVKRQMLDVNYIL